MYSNLPVALQKNPRVIAAANLPQTQFQNVLTKINVQLELNFKFWQLSTYLCDMYQKGQYSADTSL